MSSDQHQNPSEIRALRCENDELKRKMAAMKMEHQHTNVKYAQLKHDCMSMGMQMESLLAKETDHLKMVNGFKTIVEEFKQKCYAEAIQMVDDSVNDAAVEVISLDGSALSSSSDNEKRSLMDVNVVEQSGLEKPFVGEEDEQFDRIVNLQKHNRIQTKETQFAFACNQTGCGQRFARKKQLRKHYRIHPEKTPFACIQCGKRFIRKNQLRKHNHKIHGEDLFDHNQTVDGLKRPFACEEKGCGKRFLRINKLEKHKRTHRGPTPYGCEKCDRRFSRIRYLQNHQLTHTEEGFVANMSGSINDATVEAFSPARFAQGRSSATATKPLMNVNVIEQSGSEKPFVYEEDNKYGKRLAQRTHNSTRT